MPKNKANIQNVDVDVWVFDQAAMSNPPLPAEGLDVGWVEDGETKITPENKSTVTVQGGQDIKLSSKYKVEVTGVQTTAAEMASLEAYQDFNQVAFLFVNKADPTKGYLVKNMSFSVDPDFVLTADNVLKLKIEGTAKAKNFTGIYEEVTGLDAGYAA